MKYILIQTQDAGCDYTIGCGIHVTDLEAKTVAEAKEEAFAELLGKWRERDEFAATIASARILAVMADIDPAPEFDQWTADVKRAKASAIAGQKEQDERDLLEKLKAKYGEKP